MLAWLSVSLSLVLVSLLINSVRYFFCLSSPPPLFLFLSLSHHILPSAAYLGDFSSLSVLTLLCMIKHLEHFQPDDCRVLQ